MARFAIQTSDPSEDGEVDLEAQEHDSLLELRDAVRDLAGRNRPAFVVDLRLGNARFSLAEAAGALRDAFRAVDADVHVIVRSGRAEGTVRSALAAAVGSAPRRYVFGPITVEVRDADLVGLEVDALVNASNRRLKLGSGVSGALGRACGPALQAHLDTLGELAGDGLVETPAFGLTTTRALLHVPTVAGTERSIGPAYGNVIRHARARGFGTVGLAPLGTGAGMMPFEASAASLRAAVESAARTPEPPLTLVVAFLEGRGREAFAAVFDRP